MKVAVLLTRSPLLTTRNEWTLRYLAYKDAIERAHSRVFSPTFYFKKGTLTLKFLNKALKNNGLVRLPVSRRRPDTLQTAAGMTTRDNFMFRYPIAFNELQRSEIVQFQKAVSQDPASESTLEHDIHRLPEEQLYLAIKDNKGKWSLPQQSLDEQQDFLHTAAQKCLGSVCGESVESWVVGKVPVGHLADTFLMRARYLSGAVPGEHAWLSKSEMMSRFPQHKDLLSRIL